MEFDIAIAVTSLAGFFIAHALI
ncbi:hypothetical protein SPV1_13689 [Mariprofundus ferrooxydans PV-1]|uniref:Uncharacterized protein n=1 Tax=Mariprofundus ferrooxydans PV-1 TaxID=314345 RepID=Q0EZR4_9PROT|nr:hypothetical protein SPV1_13689 [Mariprofundus ferrooxydans PV-1]